MQTADLVALILAGVVAIVVVLTALTVLSLALDGQDAIPAVDAIGRIISVLVGALVGYMAGRRINGH